MPLVDNSTSRRQYQQPGMEYKMQPRPKFFNPDYIASGKLKNKVAIISGGDSGIGRSVAVHFAQEGANIVIPYLNETVDAQETKQTIEEIGRNCLLIETDLRESKNCQMVVDKTLEVFNQINILVNNAAVQFPQDSLLDITDEQIENTFRTNIFSFIYLTRSVLPHMNPNDIIINTSSITAYGSQTLIDYSATKGAINTFTKSLSHSLRDKRIRVNAICPGPVNTPLIVSSFDEQAIENFGKWSPYGRAAEPYEIAPVYVFLACDDSLLMNGEILDPNGWEIVRQ